MTFTELLNTGKVYKMIVDLHTFKVVSYECQFCKTTRKSERAIYNHCLRYHKHLEPLKEYFK